MPEPSGRRELPLPLMTRQEGIAGLAAELGVAEPVRDDVAGSWTQRRQFSVYDTDPGRPPTKWSLSAGAKVVPTRWRNPQKLVPTRWRTT